VFRNPFQEPGDWYKANLHTHTTASDGQADLIERVEQYGERGYAVLAITEHGVVSSAAHLSTKDLLVVDGVEVSVAPLRDTPLYHLVCLNIAQEATIPDAVDANDVIAWTREEGGESLVAHPYWSGNDARDLLALSGHVGIELHNASCCEIGKATSTVHWDNVLARGARLPAVAVDDAHSERRGPDLFGGWVELKMTELSVPAVLEALRTGCYYSSTGAQILGFHLQGDTVHLRCAPARQVRLIGSKWNGRGFWAAEDRPLTQVEAQVEKQWGYVRAEVVAADGTCAWSNPIYL
jgi:hypothetical protein